MPLCGETAKTSE